MTNNRWLHSQLEGVSFMLGVRTFVALVAALGIGGAAAGQPLQPPGAYIHFKKSAMLLEHLTRHADILVTNINLTRANGFLIGPVVEKGIVIDGWGAEFYNALLHPRPIEIFRDGRLVRERRTADYFVGQLANNFRMETISLYEFYTQVGPQSWQFQNQFQRVDFAYYNALSATYYYIESLRRGFLLQRAPLRCTNPELLLRRIRMLELTAFEIRRLMCLIRHVDAFHLPLTRNWIEGSYMNYRIPVASPQPAPLLFPYVVDGRPQFPPENLVPRVPQPRQYTPAYNVEDWANRWTQVDQWYNGGSPLPVVGEDPRFAPQQPGVRDVTRPSFPVGANPNTSGPVGPGVIPQPGPQQPQVYGPGLPPQQGNSGLPAQPGTGPAPVPPSGGYDY